jgi:hypothetical protein
MTDFTQNFVYSFEKRELLPTVKVRNAEMDAKISQSYYSHNPTPDHKFLLHYTTYYSTDKEPLQQPQKEETSQAAQNPGAEARIR